jgi:elongation factor Ts
MAAITSELVKDLRDSTNLPMMKCKQALEAANGDKAAAIEWLRKQGIAAADKKSGRATANGSIGMAIEGGAGVLVLLGCETDFVSGNQIFKDFVASMAKEALAKGVKDVDGLLAVPCCGQSSVKEAIANQVQKLGENIKLAEVNRLTGAVVAGYNHVGKIATLVAGTGNAEALRKVAMHVASSSPAPVALTRTDVDPAIVAKEREILGATPDVQSKPEAIRPKIIEGKLGRFFKENVLLEQEMLLDAEKGETVEQYAKRLGITVTGFVRLSI